MQAYHLRLRAHPHRPVCRGRSQSVRTDDLASRTNCGVESHVTPEAWIGRRLRRSFFGCANPGGRRQPECRAHGAPARRAALRLCRALPINRLCGSGMDAVIFAARGIKSGELDLVIAGGVESMSRAPLVMPEVGQLAFSRVPLRLFDTTIGWRFVNPRMQQLYGTDSMPETGGKRCRGEFGISRARIRIAFALRSQQNAAARAQTAGPAWRPRSFRSQ